MSGILRVFLNANLRSGHDGLTELAKEHGIKTDKIEPGSFVVFVNSQKNKIKVYAANDVIAYCRLPQGRVVNMNTIRELPHVFNGRAIDYDKALKLAVEKQLLIKTKSTIVI